MFGHFAVDGETFAYSFDMDQQHSKHHARHFLFSAASQSGLSTPEWYMQSEGVGSICTCLGSRL